MRRLAADYAYDFQAVAPFFAGDPTDRTAWARAIDRAHQPERGRADIAAIVAAQQRRRDAPLAALEAGRRLAHPRAVAILTGQQAGLFGGPLFTLLKAITALKLAERVSRDHDVPAAAVFWIEAEDHDWNEVRACTVFDDQLATRQISLPPRPAADAAPVATVVLDRAVEDALDELERVLPSTEFRAPLVAQLRSAYRPGTGMADAFGRWIEQVLGHRGLVVYDASDAASKPLVSGVFAHELATAGQTVKLAALAGSDLVSRGYHAQVHAPDDSLALFHLEDGRHPLRQREGRFIVGDHSYDAAVLLRQASEQPSQFSPNVLLRPVVQDTLFPTVCYVAGPNELAYLAQLRGVYDHFRVPMPLMYPRATATLADAAMVRFLTKHGLPLEALQPQDEAALNELLRAAIPGAVEEAFHETAAALDAQMARVAQATAIVDPTLEGAAKSTLERMQRDLETLRAKTIQAAKRRDETLRRQFMRTRALAFPGGHAQERAIGFVSFLNQYGPALVDRLTEELPLDLGRHWIVTI